MPNKVSRRLFVRRAIDLVHTSGLWSGRSRHGVDCSGVPILSLYEESDGRIDLREGWWTDRFWRDLPEQLEPLPGDLAFYGGTTLDDVEHVMIVLLPAGTRGMEGGMVIGASGVTKHITSTRAAYEAGARVTVPKLNGGCVQYRDDFRGYRSMSDFLFEEGQFS